MEVKTLSVGILATNCYIVYDPESRDAYVVDPGDDASRILRTVVALNLHVLGVVLSHVHYDHILAADEVCRETGAPLLVGAGDKDALSDRNRNLIDLFDSHCVLTLSADRLLREGDTLPLGDESLTVLETPGHTPGCICLDSGSILISGDTLFAQGAGRTDFPGGHHAALCRSLRRLADLTGDRTVYPGHGESTTLAVERLINPYMAMNN